MMFLFTAEAVGVELGMAAWVDWRCNSHLITNLGTRVVPVHERVIRRIANSEDARAALVEMLKTMKAKDRPHVQYVREHLLLRAPLDQPRRSGYFEMSGDDPSSPGSDPGPIVSIDSPQLAPRRLDGLKSAHSLSWPMSAFGARSPSWLPR